MPLWRKPIPFRVSELKGTEVRTGVRVGFSPHLKKVSGTFFLDLFRPPMRPHSHFAFGERLDLQPEPVAPPGLLLTGRLAQTGVKQAPVCLEAFGIRHSKCGIGRGGLIRGSCQGATGVRENFRLNAEQVVRASVKFSLTLFGFRS